ncbi:tRNA (adenine-N(1)-)-methyltransferase catalytic subunit trm61 [Entomortierella chlamydospora]|uniref:tRNA (adenine(58)-N(1))-methyltransferase catalytic subunit TRM61 n=1 Tax=Entomortierella chlamydospora TaxID=101097 RepID=A0A9P6N488_9FUNG|nr:tRNA (adenine-N(1)-)-methyltransferase catalytic subunit trm61 [Entomortierella chlamydospora]KAG0023010.1 tRNA (adenine-N(1)-)-methyltransferase catalytic subunit trm61 [Entomortierella chlamydospora]
MSVTRQSFASYKDNNTIENGDLVVLYLGKENLNLIRIQDGQEFCCKFGKYKHADMIGLEFGTKLGSNTGRGFVYLLYPTPELWTLVLPHRTQILYIADISFVMDFLNLKPGMSMIESGTGSGSFSHSIARTIAPSGHLYTFEYHQERVNAATKEFEEHGLSDYVTLQCRDVCKEGFGLENKVDAVFLDLPAPWEAVASAKKAFKQNKMGKICTFSPCIEQISKTVTALSEQGFVDIQMFECLIRFNELRVLPMWTIEEALEKERAAEKKRKRALPRVIREQLKKDRQDSDNVGAEDEAGGDLMGTSNKRRCTDAELNPTPVTDDTDYSTKSPRESSPTLSPGNKISQGESATFITFGQDEPREDIEPDNILVTRLPVEQRGHTSYLLFATFTPITGEN